jgi:hypothetical protein
MVKTKIVRISNERYEIQSLDNKTMAVINPENLTDRCVSELIAKQMIMRAPELPTNKSCFIGIYNIIDSVLDGININIHWLESKDWVWEDLRAYIRNHDYEQADLRLEKILSVVEQIKSQKALLQELEM